MDCAPPTLKRPAEPDIDKPNKRKQTEHQCAVCFDLNISAQYKKFSTCTKKPCNRTCNFCWTKRVKINVIDDPLAPVNCMECDTALNIDDVRAFLTTKKDLAHYEFRLQRAEALANGERECSRGDCLSTQYHSEVSDRVFTCISCCGQDCTICNTADHNGETCEEYNWRLALEHCQEESLTTHAFDKGYYAIENIGKLGNKGLKYKSPTPCPGCGIHIERDTGCPRVRCSKCNMEFCTRQGCEAPYLGRGSVPELDNAAHASTCAHSQRSRPDMRFVKRRKPSKEGAANRKALGQVTDIPNEAELPSKNNMLKDDFGEEEGKMSWEQDLEHLGEEEAQQKVKIEPEDDREGLEIHYGIFPKIEEDAEVNIKKE